MKATDGEETIRIIQSKLIDLVILDIMMSKRDEYEMMRQVRLKHHIPIIFLSAKIFNFDKMAVLVLG